MKLRFVLLVAGFLMVVLSGCVNAKEEIKSVTWDPVFTAPACRAYVEAPLLDRALAEAGLNREKLGFTRNDLMESDYYRGGYLRDEFVLPWFEWLRSNPVYAGCFEGEVAGALDYYLSQPHPVAGTIRHTAGLLGSMPDNEPPIDYAHLSGDFDHAINALCVSAGECGEATGEVPAGLAHVLTPIIWAIIDGIEARKKMDSEIGKHHNADWWQKHGGNILLLTATGELPDVLNDEDRAYLLGRGGRQDLYKAAAKIAYAIENVDWSPFVGLKEIKYDLYTKAGWIRMRDGSDDIYIEDGENVLLLLDLGGNDEHLDAVASNKSGSNPVSIAIDLSGQDRYYYETYKTPFDREGLLPADKYGRYKGDDLYGPISLSDECRQGAARDGIAMLFDFGGDDDYYQSLRCSQGYAHLGVGVLFDDGGKKEQFFLSEVASQGSAQFGIGLNITAGKARDVRKAFSYSQGFGFVGGAGFSIDAGGLDDYICDHGDPEQGGTPLYYSAQLPGTGNDSFCQGAGLGLRGQDGNQSSFLSGGIGVLREICLDDSEVNNYEASVFAQGAGYWQGTGIISVCGSNNFNAYWYVQGAAAHYAVGMMFVSGEGENSFNEIRRARNVALGTGHDYSVGVFVDDKGDNIYYISNLSAGASNCNGVGLFIDNAGNDKYIASSDHSSGMGNVSGECIKTRPNAINIGVMIDAGGKDEYNYPESEFPLPGDGKTWGHKQNGLKSEYGVGIDGEGETGIHAESGTP